MIYDWKLLTIHWVEWGSCQATGQFYAFGSLLNPDLVTPVTRQCSQGGVPSKYLEIHTVEDVQKGFDFAKEQNLKLVIKTLGMISKVAAQHRIFLPCGEFRPLFRAARY